MDVLKQEHVLAPEQVPPSCRHLPPRFTQKRRRSPNDDRVRKHAQWKQSDPQVIFYILFNDSWQCDLWTNAIGFATSAVWAA